MSYEDPDLQQKALYWAKRRDLQTKLKQLKTGLAEARVALLDGQLPVARRLFAECYTLEVDAQQLAGETNMPAPTGQVAIAFNQTVQEKFDAIIQGDLIDAATIRMQFQGMSAIEQTLTGNQVTESAVLLPRVLFEKSEQALKREQFDQAEAYLDQIIDLDRTNMHARIRLADLLLARARDVRTKANKGSTALLLLSRASAAYDQLKDSDEFASRRSDFEEELAEEQAATYYAVGEQAQRQRRLLRARAHFRRVAATSPYGPQALERVAALTTQITIVSAIIGIGVTLVVVLVLIRLVPSSTPIIANAPTSIPAALTPSPRPITEPTASSEPVVTQSAPTSTIAPLLPTTVPTAPTTPLPSATVVVLIGQITAENLLPVYKDANRAQSTSDFAVSRGTIWYLCEYNAQYGSYLIADAPCNTTSRRLGWINQKLVAPQLVTPTAVSTTLFTPGPIIVPTTIEVTKTTVP